MTIEDLIAELEASPKANRKLDEMIAIVAGYKRILEDIRRPDGVIEPKVLWIPPGSSKPVQLPGFTNSIDIARGFIHILSPDVATGCSWSNGRASARVEDGQICEAASPALALCIAGVRIKQQQLASR